MEDEKLADKLLDRILMVLMPYDQIDVERIKARLTVVLDDYQICPKQEALNCRIRQVGYDPALEDHWNQYWQRTTCLHWDDLKHCTAGCTDCDSCAEYKKIPPQYCARCGATFYERKENTFCLQCRFDRKKQAQRHWCRVNAKRGERP